MKKKLIVSTLAIAIASMTLAFPVQQQASAAQSNVIAKKTTKSYTYNVLGTKSKAIKSKSSFYVQNIDFVENVNKGKFAFNLGSVGDYTLPANFYKTNKASFVRVESSKKLTVVAKKQNVKTPYKTFKNAYVLTKDGYKVSLAKGYGVVKVTYGKQTIFELTKAKTR